MLPYKHYLAIKYENTNVIDVEESIIMYIYVYVLCSIFYYFNCLGLCLLCKYVNPSAHCLYSYILKIVVLE